jgi:uncharacterized membrane protein YqjE
MNDHAAGSGYRPGAGPGGEEPGLIRGLVITVVDALRTRLDLAAVEIEMYLLAVLQMLLWTVATVAFAVLALVFGLVSVIVALWETHRLEALLGGTLLFVILSVICGAVAARVFRRRPHLLEDTLQQLENDRQQAGGGLP